MKITDKERCDAVNAMLWNGDPKKNPGPDTSVSSITQDGGSCIITYDELIGDEPYSYAIQDCNCSEPFMYHFHYKGRF